MSNPIDLTTLVTQHRAVWPLETSIGTITLKYLRRTDADAIRNAWMGESEDNMAIALRVDQLKQIAEFPDGLDAAKATEFLELVVKMQPVFDRFAMGCFVEPQPTTVEELEALFAALTPSEEEMLSAALVKLTAPLPVHLINYSMAMLVKEYGLPLANDLTVENLTEQQAQYLEEASRRESQQLIDVMNAGSK